MKQKKLMILWLPTLNNFLGAFSDRKTELNIKNEYNAPKATQIKDRYLDQHENNYKWCISARIPLRKRRRLGSNEVLF